MEWQSENMVTFVNRLNIGIRKRNGTFNFDQINQWIMSEFIAIEKERTLYIQSGSWVVKRNIGTYR